jgi:CRP-like cAMP-binding protein
VQTQNNWYIAYFESGLHLSQDQYGLWSIYLCGFYLASMTLTTLGYGDVVAKTDAERGVFILVMLVGASAYAYAIGNIFSIISGMDTVKNDFNATLDSLNDFMVRARNPPTRSRANVPQANQNIQHELRVRVRKLFIFSLQQRRHTRYREILAVLSPGLRQEASYMVFHHLMEQVPFVSRGISPAHEFDDFVASLAEKVTLAAYPPWERLITKGMPLDRMFIVEAGALVAHFTPDPNDNHPRVDREGKLVMVRHSIPLHARREIMSGNCVGQEMIHADAVAEYYATTVVYSEIFTLTREDFEEVLSHFTETRVNLKKFLSRKNWTRLKARVTELEEEGKAAVKVATSSAGELRTDLRELKSRFAGLVEQIKSKDAELQKMSGG